MWLVRAVCAQFLDAGLTVRGLGGVEVAWTISWVRGPPAVDGAACEGESSGLFQFDGLLTTDCVFFEC